MFISPWHLPNFGIFYNDSIYSETKVNVTIKKKCTDLPNVSTVPLTQGCWKEGCWEWVLLWMNQGRGPYFPPERKNVGGSLCTNT